MSGQLDLWPAAASAYAHRLDLLVLGVTLLMGLLAGPVFILTAVFAVRYRRGHDVDRSHPENRNVYLEVSWALLPTLLILVFFVWSARMFAGLHQVPANALEIDVVAKQWMWKFQHMGGQREINDLHVPVGLPIKLVMTSQDVIHSLFLPALRLKQDVLPGRYTILWFKADRPGAYRLACTQFCGTDHSVMGGTLYIMSRTDYARWLDQNAVDQTLAQQGKAVFAKVGCGACHSPNATVHAPDLGGLAGRMVPLTNGQSVVATDQYIRDSILEPNEQIVAGYQPIMPTFKNVLSEDDLVKIIAYIRSLGEANHDE